MDTKEQVKGNGGFDHVAVQLAGSTAPELHARQLRYDMLHHRNRLQWLSSDAPAYGCGTPVRLDHVLNMRTQSKAALELGISTNSVDLSDAEYLAELDAFALEAA